MCLTTMKILKLAYYRNYCIDSIQILQWQRPPNDLLGWSKHTYNKSTMADDRQVENRKTAISSLAKVRPIWTKFGMGTHVNH